MASSPANIADARKHTGIQTIGPDKINQLRHAKFFRDARGIHAHMAKHATLPVPTLGLNQPDAKTWPARLAVFTLNTEAEARQVYRSIIEQGDWVAADNLMKVLGIESQSFNDRIQKYRERLVAGWGTNPIIGTPEQVTSQLAQVSAAGIDGVVFGFLDYNEELKFFDSAVMPLLRQAGLRS